MGQLIAKSLIAGTLLYTSHHACAVSTLSSASITNFSFSVTDLDLNDGIEGSYSFITNPGPSKEYYYPSGSVAEVGEPWALSNDAFANLSAKTGVAGQFGYSASISSSALTASAFESRNGGWGHAANWVSAGANNGTHDAPVLSRLLLVLTPHTKITFTGDFMASAQTDCSPADLLAYNCRAIAFAHAQFGGAYSLTDHHSVDWYGSSTVNAVSAVNNHSETKLGSAVWASNTNDDAVVMGFVAIAYADGQLMGIPAVPEPATAWMVGFGLVALGAAARRRRSP